ncbi:Golgi integral membrane protein 4-like isoform X2 [Spea bombifrons]|uniref:Golgi integral membrane protein 4-like isoform X2 n=1 Tax=Spea bombifrons TaxID=233779 RepID=UPI00234ABA3A|nr:Golgi integral membrane protein 4-like isoform X2 [Spea bombifrons]
MGTGVCSRRQKSLLHTGFCLLAVLGLASGGFLYNYIIQKAKISEAQAVKFKQQQEALSAQLQVVYEHRSRLERSLQKERSEHKKTKEDFLVYKLEAQEALNKEKQDSMNRYGALNSQHKILKNQHDELKKQLNDLQFEHSNLKLEHRKTIENHNQKISQLQREKDSSVSGLQDTISKLREESKLLRKAHLDVHSQLLGAQAQVEEFRQLKDALKKMPSFKDHETRAENHQFLTAAKKGYKVADTQAPQKLPGNDKSAADLQIPGGETLPAKTLPSGLLDSATQDNSLVQSPSVRLTPPRPGTPNKSENHVMRFARTVNSLQGPKEEVSEATIHLSEERQYGHRLQAALNKEGPMGHALTVNKQVPIQSWQDIVKKVNERMTEEEEGNEIPDKDVKPEAAGDDIPAVNWGRRSGYPAGNQDAKDEELEMDAGMIDREENPQSPKQHVGREPSVPEVREEQEEPYQDDQEQDNEERESEQLENGEDLGQDHREADKQDGNRRHEYY